MTEIADWNALIRDVVAGRWTDPATGKPITLPFETIEIAESLDGREADLVAALGLGKRLAVVSDTNTVEAMGRRVGRALGTIAAVDEIVLPDGLACDEPSIDMLREKGLIQEQAPLPGRIEEIVEIAERHGRDPGMLHFPDREIRRLMADDDWDFGPNLRARADEVLATEDLPDYPEEMRETFRRLMSEHGIEAGKFLPDEG